MHCTVGELRQRMDTTELAEWVAWGRYKSALEKAAREKAKAEAEQARRKPVMPGIRRKRRK